MTEAEILQAIQNATDNGATVEYRGTKIILTFPDGTVKTLVVLPQRIDEPIPTEDGEQAQGTGATHYDDNMGDVIELLDAQGVIPPVEMEFGLISGLTI